MQIIVYLDIIFFINFIVDFFVLLLTGIILKQKIVCWRVIAGALFGAVSLLPFFLRPNLLTGKTGIILCTGISMGAVAISLGRKKGGLVKKWFLSTTIMVLLGGMINYLRCITGVTSVSLGIWMVLFAGGGAGCFYMIRFLQKMLHKGKHIYLIRIKHGMKEAMDYVYLDTGNMLWDPLFSKPVILLSESFVGKCLTEEEKEFIEEYKKKGYINYKKQIVLDIQKKACFHEIAYQSVGNPSGKLLCLIMEEIVLKKNGQILVKQPVAIGSADLFEGKEYQGLLHFECI